MQITDINGVAGEEEIFKDLCRNCHGYGPEEILSIRPMAYGKGAATVMIKRKVAIQWVSRGYVEIRWVR